jgi:hypothetical protein
MRFALIGILVLLAPWRPAEAAVLVLSGGGRIEGELLNPDEKPRKTYVLKLPSGGEISIEAQQVQQVLAAQPNLEEYQRIRSQYPDTVEGQWDLALWCRDHALPAQRKSHLERVIQLDPDYAPARRLLGYNKIQGQWMTQDEWMTKQGYRRYKNEWKLPQEIELLESRRKKDLAEKEWIAKIARWRTWLSGDRGKQARANLLAIGDPMAVKGLAMILRRDGNPQDRLLYVEILSKIRTPESEATLAVTAMEDDVEEIRLSCLDVLEKGRSPLTVAYFVGKLRDKDNDVVNRAGVALGRLKDHSTIGPLIDALITTHKHKFDAASPGQMSATFPTRGSPGGGGIGFNQQPKIVSVRLENQAVLDALAVITGQNFSFDQRAWKTWYRAQGKSPQIDARRN